MKESNRDKFNRLGTISAMTTASIYASDFPDIPHRIIENAVMRGYRVGWMAKDAAEWEDAMEAQKKARKKKGGKR